MSENCSHRDAQACGGALRHGHVCELWFLVLALLILVRSGDALAGEQVSIAGTPYKPDFNAGSFTGQESTSLVASRFDLPQTYQATDPTADERFSAKDFRPRGPSILERESQSDASEDMPMLHGTSVWQRLADYRAHGRVRLLTLLETGGSSVSLQAGKKGEPSLQWTSRSMNRGGATRGVFDRLVSASVAGANRGFHPAPRPNPSEPTPRPSKPSDVGIGANK